MRVVFPEPTPFWARPFVGAFGLLIPKHLFDAYRGAKSREAPTNLKPVGTGPYRFVDFKPGDVVRGEINPAYHEPNRPHFDAIEMKGGGDAVSAARAVLQTGEFDYAWNVQVEDEILKRLEQGGKGRVILAPGNAVEHVLFNFADPWTEVDGERSSAKTRHPILSEPAVREAINLLVDRGSIQEYVYGRTGIATRNFLNNPERFRSPNTTVGVRRRQGEPGPRGRRMEARRRRHSREGRQEAQVRLPDLDQRAAPEMPADHQAGVPEGGHRARPEGDHGLGVLLLRRRQSGHQHQVLRRPHDVQHRRAARPVVLHESVLLLGDCVQGEQMGGPQHQPLAQRANTTRPIAPPRTNSIRRSARHCSSA